VTNARSPSVLPCPFFSVIPGETVFLIARPPCAILVQRRRRFDIVPHVDAVSPWRCPAEPYNPPRRPPKAEKMAYRSSYFGRAALGFVSRRWCRDSAPPPGVES
jgi:hypothetical protein